MTKKNDWKRITICMTPDEWRMLHFLSGVKMMSISEYIRKVVEAKIDAYEEEEKVGIKKCP